MSKLTRTIAGRKVHAVTRTVTLAEISRDARYQHRLDDNPYIRGKDIAKSVRDCGAERFRDNIIAVEIDGTLYVVDGFGRQAAAAMLKWDHLDVDIIQGRNPAAIGSPSPCAQSRPSFAKGKYRQGTSGHCLPAAR